MATVGWRRPEFSRRTWFEANPEMFCDRNKTMIVENARAVRRSVDAHEEAREKERKPLH
jgi:hypothetical protein